MTEPNITNHHIYFVPFDSSMPQQELAAIPAADNNGINSFAVFTGKNGNPDQVLSCSYLSDRNRGDDTNMLRAQVATFSNNQWNWSSPNVSTTAINGQVCRLSLDKSSMMNSNNWYENAVYDQPAAVWIYSAAATQPPN